VSGDAFWYFAYGSNMSGAVLRGRRGLQPLAARPATLHGYRLVFTLPIGPGERGCASVEPDAGASMCGVIYLLSASECEHLDRTEGVPRVYRRVPVEALTADGERLAAFTYQSMVRDERRKPSARYLGLLLDGCREHCLPAEWIAYLEALPLAVDERLTT
jgi:cation transport regulator ChaC